MPKYTCQNCGAEIIEVPFDEEENFTLPVCSNEDCPTNSCDFYFNNDISRKTQENKQSPANDQEIRIDVLRKGLAVIRLHILRLIENRDMSSAKAFLEDVINSFLSDKKIPPGRSYATISKAYQAGMKKMALIKLNSDAGDPDKLWSLTKAVFNWLLQTEDELRQDLIEQLSSLIETLNAQMTAYKDSPAGVEMMRRIGILFLAIEKVDREGSSPVLDSKKMMA